LFSEGNMTPSNTPPQNRILAALSLSVYEQLQPDLELVSIRVGDEIHAPGIPISHLYFPLDCIVACVAELSDGETLLTSLTGPEGMVGISCLLGYGSAPARVVALSGGSALRIKSPVLKKEFDAVGELQRLVLGFTHARILQKAYIAMGARYDSIEQQLCGFLLMALDRLPAQGLHITHEQVSIMLGVRRESITVVSQKLGMTGAIHYRRGHLTVVDRKVLESRTGASYAIASMAY
jgi:CRP-like cAMP-binding protein